MVSRIGPRVARHLALGIGSIALSVVAPAAKANDKKTSQVPDAKIAQKVKAPGLARAGDGAPTPPSRAEPNKSYYVPTRGYRLEPQPDIPPYVRNLGKTYKEFEGIDWLNVGLDSRVRFEYRKNDYRPWTNTATDPPTSQRRPYPNSLWLLRTRSYVGVQNVLDPLRFAVEFQDSRAFNSIYELQGQEIDEADLIAGYSELFFKDIFGKDDRGNDRPLTVRAGRMHFEILDRRFIAENEFRNTTNSFDGFRLKVGKKENDWDVDSFVMRPVNRDPYAFDRPDWQNWVYGTVLSVRRWSEYATIQPYFIGRKQYGNPLASSNALKVHRDTYAPGLRLFGVLGNFDYDVNVNKQFGDVGEFQLRDARANSFQETVRQDALAYALESGYTLTNHPWKPRISASYAYGTGSSSPFDRVNQTVDGFYGFNQPFSRNDYIGWNNVRAPKVRIEFSPAKDLRIDSALSAYWLASASAAWDRANLVAPLGNRGTFMGTEADLRIRYKLSPFVNLTASYARFWPGGFPASFAPPDQLQPLDPQITPNVIPRPFPGRTVSTNGLTARPTDFFYLEMTANGFGDGQPIAGDPARDFLALAETSAGQPKPSASSWRDIYVGVNLGGSWAAPRSTMMTTPFGPSPFSPLVARTAQMPLSEFAQGGFVGGFQIGGNYRFNSGLVAGLEADLRGAAGHSQNKFQFESVRFAGNTFDTYGYRNVSLNYLGTVRPRLGYLVTPTLQVYGTGGLAYGGFTSIATTFTNRVFGLTQTVGETLFQDARLGWTAGGGIEWAFNPRWSAKAEYLHYDLGVATAESAVFHRSNFYWFGMTSQTSFGGNIIQAGINRHFDLMGKN